MKIKLTESQFNNIIKSQEIDEELNPVDEKRLKNAGENIVDVFYTGPYTAVLVKNRMGRYQIGLTSHDYSFTSPTDQEDRPSKEDMKTIMSLWKNLTDKIKVWVEKYGEIHGGSMNKEKTIKYRNIFMRYGLNCSEVYKVEGGGGTGFVITP